MLRDLSLRCASAGLTLLALSIFGFALLVLLPGDFAEVVLINQLDGELPSPEALAKFKAQEGFDQPLPVQYLNWLGATLSGDFGVSFTTGDPVTAELGLRIVATFRLVGLAFCLTAVFGGLLGVIAALNRGSIVDRLVTAVAISGMSVPNFWQSLLFVLLFSLTLGWLPSSGYGGLSHAILPAAVIATASMGLTARYVRASLIEALAAPHVRTALAKGLSPRATLFSHALPAALPGILTLLGLQAARMFDGAIVVETIFAWPGLGRLFVDAILNRDYPVLQAAILAVGTTYILINLAVDCAAAALDPRMRRAV
ncbi:MAG: ABC transporter permease [Pseudomonadota bacterium]